MILLTTGERIGTTARRGAIGLPKQDGERWRRSTVPTSRRPLGPGAPRAAR